MSVTSLAYVSNMTVVETLTTNVPAASTPSVTHNGFNTTQNLNSGTTPPVTQVAAFIQLLSAGAATIDLTALTGTNGSSVSGSGLKIQAIKVIALGTNANPVTLKFGASNPYNLMGSAWQVALSAGEEFLFFGNNAAPTIGGSAKTIDLSGTGTQGVDVIIVMG